jgi:hypothetical protein
MERPFGSWNSRSIRIPHHVVSNLVICDGVVYAIHLKETLVYVMAPAENLAPGTSLFLTYLHMNLAASIGIAFLIGLCASHTLVFFESARFAWRFRNQQISLRLVPAEGRSTDEVAASQSHG